MRSSRRSPSGLVITRFVNPVPAAFVVFLVQSAPTRRSFALVVVTEPLLAAVLLPTAATDTSSGLPGSKPLYSAIRTSGYEAAAENVTVTRFVFAEAAAMFFA